MLNCGQSKNVDTNVYNIWRTSLKTQVKMPSLPPKTLWKRAYHHYRKHKKNRQYVLPEWVFGPNPDSLEAQPLHSAWRASQGCRMPPQTLAERLADYKLVKAQYHRETGRTGPPTMFW